MRKRLSGYLVWVLIVALVAAVAVLAWRSAPGPVAAGRDDPRGWVDEAPAAHSGHAFDGCDACERERLMREAADR